MIKALYYLFLTFLFVITALLIMTGCEYDVAEPQWEKPYTNPPIPQIISIEPAMGAAPGVNLITINGENFLDVPDEFGVYFDKTDVEVVSKSTTSLTVRRPNLVADSCTIMVVPNQTLVVAKYSPYRVDKVVETYGGFVENLARFTVAVDADENIYVIEYPRNIIKVTPEGEQSVIGTARLASTDATIGPDGRMYLCENNRSIEAVDLQTGSASRWIQLDFGRAARYGTFDSYGYFYTGGNGTGLITVSPELAETGTGYYNNDFIFGVSVYANHLYLAVRMAAPDELHPELAIWRHALDDSGHVSAGELVFDLTQNEDFVAYEINSIHHAADGTLYIGTESPNPMLIAVSGGSEVDYFYKYILPSNCIQFNWGTGNYIYMLTNDSNEDVQYQLYRIDMGIAGAQ